MHETLLTFLVYFEVKFAINTVNCCEVACLWPFLTDRGHLDIQRWWWFGSSCWVYLKHAILWSMANLIKSGVKSNVPSTNIALIDKNSELIIKNDNRNPIMIIKIRFLYSKNGAFVFFPWHLNSKALQLLNSFITDLYTKKHHIKNCHKNYICSNFAQQLSQFLFLYTFIFNL